MKVVMTQTKMPVADAKSITTEFTLTCGDRVVSYVSISGMRVLCRVYAGINILGREFQANDVVPALHNNNNEFRPLYIFENDIKTGEVFSSTIKSGPYASKTYTMCAIDGVDYITYFNQIGDANVGSVYAYEKMVGQFSHSHSKLEQPHVYEIDCVDDAALTACVFTALRNYIVVYLKPGLNELTTKRVVWGYSKNEWPEKYDPDWNCG